MRQSGLVDLLPELPSKTVYVGVSAGSMVVTPTFGEHYEEINSPTSSEQALGLVDFSLYPHLDYPTFPENSLDSLERWAARLDVSAYLVDDQTAIKVTNGIVEVVSEGHWKLVVP